MVGRLVHQQDVGLAENDARHGDPHLPPAAERAHVAVNPLVVEAEAVEDFPRLAFDRVAAEVFVLLLHLAEAREDAVHVAGLRRVGHGVLQRLELVVQVAQPSAAGNHLVDDRPARHLLDVLPEVADGQLLRHRDVAFVGVAPRRRSSGTAWSCRTPFGPTRPTFSPGLSWNEVSTNRTCRPYCLLMRVNEIMGAT